MSLEIGNEAEYPRCDYGYGTDSGSVATATSPITTGATTGVAAANTTTTTTTKDSLLGSPPHFGASVSTEYSEDSSLTSRERERDYRRYRGSSPSGGYGSRSRRSRSRSHDRDTRSRSPYYRDRSPPRRRRRSRSHSRDYEGGGGGGGYYRGGRSPRYDDYSSDSGRYRDKRIEVLPNNTIVLKGLPLHCDEAMIWETLSSQNFHPKDVRILKKRETGQSRGFGFVEFLDVDEAKRWMDFNQGHLEIEGCHVADLQYSINKPPYGSVMNLLSQRGGDWICSKCSTNNFKKRDQCFKCGIRREESDALSGEGFSEIGVMPCDTLLFRNLPYTLVEDTLLQLLSKYTALEVQKVVLSRNPETNQSRGFAYVQMKSLTDAAQLLTTLTAVTKMIIEGREVLVSYSKLPLAAVLAGAALSQNIDWSSQLLGHGPASIASISGATQTDTTNAAAAVAQSAIKKAQVMRQVAAQQVQAAQLAAASAATSLIVPGSSLLVHQQQQAIIAAQALQEMAAVQLMNEHVQTQAAASAELGSVKTPFGDLPRYPQPDVSHYQYDQTSGYYYDPSTGLYYDANTQYYFSTETQQFLYWDASYQTYLPATNTSSQSSGSDKDAAENKGDKTKKEPKDKREKVKIAKKIQKDMDKWAKQLNQKKDVAKAAHPAAAQPPDPASETKQSATADAAFSVLERSSVGSAFGAGLVSYETVDSDDEALLKDSVSSEPKDSADKLTDWGKMACLLCRRQFPNKEALMRHQQFSELHKQNLEVKKHTAEMFSDLATKNEHSGQYRDRARERREKFGLDDDPQPNKLKEKYLESLECSLKSPSYSSIGTENIGSKLLKSMGWQEGQGLGRKNQGITNPIVSQRRIAGAGLGSSGAVVSANPTSSYKEHVKAALRQKFYENT